MVGQAKANDTFSRGIHLLSAGNSDFIQNYYITPLLTVYTPDQFSDILIRSYSTFIQVTPHSYIYIYSHTYITAWFSFMICTLYDAGFAHFDRICMGWEHERLESQAYPQSGVCQRRSPYLAQEATNASQD